MKILDKYIGKSILSAIGLVTLVLTGLQIFILFVNQLGDVGRVDFGIVDAALVVFMQLPYQIYLFFPMASLLGCLIGLGNMASHSELVVMRAAGMSIGQITVAVLKASLVVIALVTIIGETLVPYMSHYAMNTKVSALTGGQSLLTARGMWLRHDNDFISIAAVLPNNVVRDIYQFRFDNDHHLQFARYIREAHFENNSWVGIDVAETQFYPKKTEVQTFASIPWDVKVKPEILQISHSEPDEMTLFQLVQYIKEQKQAQQNVHTYQLALLQRLLQPFTTMVMMILSIPFIFGPLRSSTMGFKLIVGATVGFSFYILNKFFGPLSLVYQMPPAIAAFGPTLLFALLGLYLMKRVR